MRPRYRQLQNNGEKTEKNVRNIFSRSKHSLSALPETTPGPYTINKNCRLRRPPPHPHTHNAHSVTHKLVHIHSLRTNTLSNACFYKHLLTHTHCNTFTQTITLSHTLEPTHTYPHTLQIDTDSHTLFLIHPYSSSCSLSPSLFLLSICLSLTHTHTCARTSIHIYTPTQVTDT
ncbi:hypothetical protein BsWGS_17516 [Bradybaena similaris]